MTTLKDARAACAARIVTAVNDSTVTVLGHEPPTVSGSTVTVATAGVRPDWWRFFIRIYVNVVQSAEGQDAMDTIVEAIDLHPGMQPVGRLDWDLAYDDAKDCLVMQAVAEWPREDF